eukprot:TRINITY_DN44548_c0_g1_i1.p1 TRINITY_DN44548_c0_g1~~TRINITY_DN44548_c0_g1_i1.p1  ORF type:complete len:445 (+),score=112.67 TRINITY_DN44548_c0_g1_i1:171-1505(+)
MSPYDQSVTTYLIWVIRVVVPIILFVIWFKSQTKEDDESGPAYDRDELVAVRQAAGLSWTLEAPATLRSLKLMEETELQKLGFTGAGGAQAGARGRRDGPGGGGKGGKQKGSGKGGIERAGSGGIEMASPAPKREEPKSAAAAPSQPEASLMSDEERQSLESMLTWVAFRHKDRPQRYYLPDKELGCPPPVPKRGVGHPTMSLPSPAPEACEKANAEAQAVLKGLNLPQLGLQSASIAQAMYRKLTEDQVQIAEATFLLMMDACVNARDLKAASEFLIQMEACGYTPNSALLDKVMDLYTDGGGGDGGAKVLPGGGDASAPDVADGSDNAIRQQRYLFADHASPLISGGGHVGLKAGGNGGVASVAGSTAAGANSKSGGSGFLSSTPTSLRPGGAGSLTGTGAISLRPGGGLGTPDKRAAPWAKKSPGSGPRPTDDVTVDPLDF